MLVNKCNSQSSRPAPHVHLLAGWRLAATLAIGALVLSMVAAVPARAATVILVPQDFPAIQSALDAAFDGDTIRVSAGTYVETINFRGKAVTLESTAGRDATVIDGNSRGSVVTMTAESTKSQVLRGFTLRGGYASFGGGGVFTAGGPALIENNLVSGNFGCPGAGIAASFSAATIRGNIISNNRQNCSGGPGGGGVSILGAGTVRLLSNLITGNLMDSGGGGISLFAAGAPTIDRNVITNNSGGSGGGAISLFNQSDALITNNLMVGNSAFAGGGMFWLVPSGAAGPMVFNNTIALNTAQFGTAVFADGFDSTSRLANNIMVGSGSQTVLHCGNFDPNPPVILFNDAFNTSAAPAYGGICANQAGLNGNISADPLLVNVGSGDFHPRPGSPAVDTGTNNGAPVVDIEGNARPLDGNGDGISVVDMGAYELVVDATPPAIQPVVTPVPNANGWSNADVTVAWNVSDPESGIVSTTGCDATILALETASTTLTCSARNGVGLTASASVVVKLDKTAPVVTFSGNAGTYTVDQTISITCSASDALSGIAISSCPGLSGPAYSLDLGTHSLTASATDLAGNSTVTSTSFTVEVTYSSLCTLSRSFETDPQIADSLCAQLAAAEAGATGHSANAKAGALRAYINLVRAQADKTLTVSQADLLIVFATAL